MNCPVCNREMEQGFVRAKKGMAWVRRPHKFEVLGFDEGDIVFHSKSIFRPVHIKAYICKACEKILVDYYDE